MTANWSAWVVIAITAFALGFVTSRIWRRFR